MGAMDTLTGPMYIGTAVQTLLFGFQLMQTHIYYISQKKDPKWMKWMVGILLIADAAQAIFCLAWTYHYTITEFGNLAGVVVATPLFDTDPVLTALIASIVQVFFGWRVRKLTKKTWIGLLIWASSLVQFLAGVGTTIACTIVPHFSDFHKFSVIVSIWLAFTALTDLIITVSLIWYLQSHKTGFAVTDDLVSRLVRITIQTGAITTVFSIVDLILFLAYPNTLHLIFNLPLSKLYSNSLLSSLNARSGWAYGKTSEETSTPKGRDMGSVNVTTSAFVHRDGDYDIELAGRTPSTGRTPATPYSSTGLVSSEKKRPMDDGLSLHSDSSIEENYQKTGGLGSMKGGQVEYVVTPPETRL